ncbi:hypothetical protein J132_04223, partial [Termitomyces sp. J132]
SKNYMKIISSLSHCNSAICTQLWTGHSPLNQHLFHIKCMESLVCPNCSSLVVEMVRHFVLECPQYHHKYHAHFTYPFKHKAELLTHILSHPDPLKHLFRYINATKCF